MRTCSHRGAVRCAIQGVPIVNSAAHRARSPMTDTPSVRDMASWTTSRASLSPSGGEYPRVRMSWTSWGSGRRLSEPRPWKQAIGCRGSSCRAPLTGSPVWFVCLLGGSRPAVCMVLHRANAEPGPRGTLRDISWGKSGGSYTDDLASKIDAGLFGVDRRKGRYML